MEYGQKRVVRIVLECFLVVIFITKRRKDANLRILSILPVRRDMVAIYSEINLEK